MEKCRIYLTNNGVQIVRTLKHRFSKSIVLYLYVPIIVITWKKKKKKYDLQNNCNLYEGKLQCSTLDTGPNGVATISRYVLCEP